MSSADDYRFTNKSMLRTVAWALVLALILSGSAVGLRFSLTSRLTTSNVSVETPVEYVVEPGDTLSSIAASALGDSRRWRELADLNGIEQPDLILVGQVLQLPPKE